MRFKTLLIFTLAVMAAVVTTPLFAQKTKPGNAPKIVNIVNFIRDIEPRDANITKDVLYQTVVNQIALMKQYHLGGTFCYSTMP
ncbi:hypothetical protein ACRQ5D_24415 [Mucilaginibacter sp. P25]|uniref:hypothetical protein n=1 Tax=Mucilaginibacter sp. P25 TaxID=3423945 RepID=UPI003D79B3B1